MSKLTYAGSFAIALTLILGSVYFSQSFIMSFASSSEIMTLVRAGIALLMVGLMVTNPPRSHMFRALLGATGAALVLWSLQYIFSGSIAIADALFFLHAALSFGIAALEPNRYKNIDFNEYVANEQPLKYHVTA